MTKETIDIIIPSSDKYLPYVSALIVSALENINENYRLSFHIITEDIKPETIRKTELLSRKYDFDIEYKYITSNTNFELPFCVNAHIDSKIVYAKLIASSLFPQLERAIILEGDMIVTGDLSELWNINIDNYCIAATKDAWYKTHNSSYKSTPYFNTGMFYANLTKWRQMNFEKKVAEVIPTAELKFPDQDLFNIIFKDDVLYLDWCWNAATCIYAPWFNCLTDDEKHSVLDNHKILHFIHKLKPWSGYSSPYSEYFWYYARLTPFYEQMCEQNLSMPVCLITKEDLKLAFNYRKYVLKYWKYKILANITFGQTKARCKAKKQDFKNKIRKCKELRGIC